MALRVSSFFFKRGLSGAPVGPVQLSILKSEVETPGLATQSDIIGLYECDGDKLNTDPNTLGLYGNWAGSSPVYAVHTGVLNDLGYDQHIQSNGLNKSGWTSGTLDTYYNTDGITISWIQALVPATNAKLATYWQADTERLELICLSTTVLRVNIEMGTGTLQVVDMTMADFRVTDGFFHHYVISFHPTGDRIARVYIDGALAGTTAAVTGTSVFGDVVTSVRRGIGFGRHYTNTIGNASGSVDHCVILKGIYTPNEKFFPNQMVLDGDYTKYYGDQMTYNPVE